MMTIEELEQYRYEKEECEDLKRRMSQTGGRTSIVRDTVRGSMAEYPFTAHTIRIEGISSKSMRCHAILKAQYRRKREKLLLHTVEVEKWLDTVRDAKIRCIVRYRYIDGKEWREVSRRVYGQRSYNRAYMALLRFFTNCS
jgi:hypothetical protein